MKSQQIDCLFVIPQEALQGNLRSPTSAPSSCSSEEDCKMAVYYSRFRTLRDKGIATLIKLHLTSSKWILASHTSFLKSIRILLPNSFSAIRNLWLNKVSFFQSLRERDFKYKFKDFLKKHSRINSKKVICTLILESYTGYDGCFNFYFSFIWNYLNLTKRYTFLFLAKVK